jgi:hypothetical protein
MQILYDAIRFSHRRLEAALAAGTLDGQQRMRIAEARDMLRDAIQFTLGEEEAEIFLSEPDGYRIPGDAILRHDPPPSAKGSD